jgi:hypothetical protein
MLVLTLPDATILSLIILGLLLIVWIWRRSGKKKPPEKDL